MRSTYSLPTWMIEQVNNKKENTPVTDSRKPQCSDNQKDKRMEEK